MADERELNDDASVNRDAAIPQAEVDYWREIHALEPYFESDRGFDDYAPAYELGWVSYVRYGTDFDIADRALANDWEQCKGISQLSWDEARPAARAAWQRADNGQSFATDGTASREQTIEA